MKNFKLLLAGAIMIAVGSSFAASSKVLEGEYVLQGSTYVLKSTLPAGRCEETPNNICDYTKINPSGSNTDPANFTPHQSEAAWVFD